MTRLILLVSAAIFAASANAAGPSEFSIVSVLFSDNGALLYYRVLEVSQEAAGSMIRYSRIAAGAQPSWKQSASVLPPNVMEHLYR